LQYTEVILGLIHIVILLFISIKYNDLTKKYNKPTRLYNTLGVLFYFVPLVVVNNWYQIYNASVALSLAVGAILGGIISCALYFALKKIWADNDKNNPDILDDDMMI
jgi:glucose uptake protein GlcU